MTIPALIPLVPMPVLVTLVILSMWMEGHVMTLTSVLITTIFVHRLALIYPALMFVTVPLDMFLIPMVSAVLMWMNAL